MLLYILGLHFVYQLFWRGQLVVISHKPIIGDQQAQSWRERVTQSEGIIYPMIHAILDHFIYPPGLCATRLFSSIPVEGGRCRLIAVQQIETLLRILYPLPIPWSNGVWNRSKISCSRLLCAESCRLDRTRNAFNVTREHRLNPKFVSTAQNINYPSFATVQHLIIWTTNEFTQLNGSQFGIQANCFIRTQKGA